MVITEPLEAFYTGNLLREIIWEEHGGGKIVVRILNIFHNIGFLCFLCQAWSAMSFHEKALLLVPYRCFDCYVSRVWFSNEKWFLLPQVSKEELQGTGCKYFDVTMKLKGKFYSFFYSLSFFPCAG